MQRLLGPLDWAPVLRLVTFGACYLERDGARLEAASAHRKGLALLALVAAAGDRGVGREAAMALLWPDSDEERARTSMRQLVHSLRTRLDAPNLLSSTPELRLDPQAITSDVGDFRAALRAGDLSAAVGHYGGDFLEGFHLRGAGELERWISGERTALAQEASRAFEELAVRAEREGDAREAVGWWRRLAAAEPLSARAATGLMRALDASGERAAALQHARVYELLVAEELGDVPDASVSALADELRGRPPVSPGTGVARPGELPAKPSGDGSIGGERQEPGPGAVDRAPVEGTAEAATEVGAGPVDRAHATGREPGPRWRLALVVSAAVLLAALGLQVGRRGPPVPSAGPPSVVVLPLVNTSGDPLDEAMSDGLTDNLISALATVPGLRVIGRTSAFAFKRSGLDLRVIADSLRVSAVLEGSLQRSGEQLKVNVQLVSARDATVLWSGIYDRRLRDLFAVQDEITGAIVQSLSARLNPGPPPGGRVVQDMEAYESYLRGRQIFTTRTEPEAIDLAESHFREALRRDPTLAEAHSGLSDVYTRRAVFGFAPPGDSFQRAKAAALRALELDSTLAAAHTSLGHARCVADYDWQGAGEAFERAVALEPGYTFGRLPYAICLASQGRFEEAERQLEIARDFDPLALAVSNVAGRLYVAWRRPAQAILHLRHALELSPQMDLAWQQLGHAHLLEGRVPEAVAALERAAALSGARDSLHLAYAHAVTGQGADAEAILDSVLAAPGVDALAYHVALAQVGLGRADAAFQWLRRGFELNGSFMGWLAIDPGFEPLHDDARWEGLLRTLGVAGS